MFLPNRQFFWDIVESSGVLMGVAVAQRGAGTCVQSPGFTRETLNRSWCTNRNIVRMLATLTLNGQVTKIVMTSGSQLSELKSVSQKSQVSRIVFAIVKIEIGQQL